MLYDSTYIKCPVQANMFRQKIDKWLQRRVNGERMLMESEC